MLALSPADASMEQGFLPPSSHARMPRDGCALSPGPPLAPWASGPPASPHQLAASSMGGSGGLYAGKKRKKPVIRSPKAEVVVPKKTNPSKRHRDRLNAEMERLAGMLPFPPDVISKLDKLSILRLSVSFLRTKSFFGAVNHKRHLSNGIAVYGVPSSRVDVPAAFPEGEMLLQALHGFALVVTAEGLVFYTSHTIQEYLGFHQCDVVHQSVYELVHTEDRGEFRRQLHWALNPASTQGARGGGGDGGQGDGRAAVEQGLGTVTTFHPQQLPPENSSFLERQFMCRFRCLLDNSSGFLALLIQGRLKLLHGQNQRGLDGSPTPPQLALFGVATPLQPPSILEIRTRNIIFRTKHKLDFTPTGCDAKGRIVLGYSEMELCMRGTGYQFIHAGDMLYCADNHVRMMKTGESGFTIFRLLTKDNGWAWVQANARLVYKGNRPDYIIATQRPLSDEEGEEHLRKRATQFPFTFTTGEALLYNTDVFQPPMGDPSLGGGGGGGSDGYAGTEQTAAAAVGGESQAAGGRGGGKSWPMDPSSLMAALMLQNQSVYVRTAASSEDRLPSYTFNDASWLAPSSVAAGGSVCRRGGDDDFNRSLGRIKLEEHDGGRAGAPLTPYSGASTRDELTDILDTLGVNVNDIELVEEERQLIMGDMEMSSHLGNILSNDDIISFVEDLLKKPDCCVAPGPDRAASQLPNPNAGAVGPEPSGAQLGFPSPPFAHGFEFYSGRETAQNCVQKAPMSRPKQAAMSEGSDIRNGFLAQNFFDGANGRAVVVSQGTSNVPALGLPKQGTPRGGAGQWNANVVSAHDMAHARSGYVDGQLALGSKLQNWSPTMQPGWDCANVTQDQMQMPGVVGQCGVTGPALVNNAHGHGTMDGSACQGPFAGLPSHGYAGGVLDFGADPVASFPPPCQGPVSAGLMQNGRSDRGWPAAAAHVRQHATVTGAGIGTCLASAGNGDPWNAAPVPPYTPMEVEGMNPPQYSACVSQMHVAPVGSGVAGLHPDLAAHFHQQPALTQPVVTTFDLRSNLVSCHPSGAHGHEAFLGGPEVLPSFPDILRTGQYS
ncbi:aryl hydrocarbon receptor-like isoform X1 [Lethenteron reissneri]|uniref:aryl hydrocarbon receptor-like isoform X1 n=2 Tax=Lethenteron reissneri TaxID=7753 RepID=UPI002AB7BED0|nr:aryl hydrocarbon receptor-like isoform X1 [Lethenteron reissneri]